MKARSRVLKEHGFPQVPETLSFRWRSASITAIKAMVSIQAPQGTNHLTEPRPGRRAN
jgi:hypothetical protein